MLKIIAIVMVIALVAVLDLGHVRSEPLISKVMGVFFSMDAVIGKDFATGLANLHSAAES